jgi:hypothetical protein
MNLGAFLLVQDWIRCLPSIIEIPQALGLISMGPTGGFSGLPERGSKPSMERPAGTIKQIREAGMI